MLGTSSRSGERERTSESLTTFFLLRVVTPTAESIGNPFGDVINGGHSITTVGDAR